MQVSGRPIGLWSAVALGVGAMVGAGIFALLGDAGRIAGSAVYLSFIAGGGIALLSGYSLARLGARFPSAGGLVEYLVQGYGQGVFSGAMSVSLYLAAVVSVALVARTFGSYAATFFPAAFRPLLVPLLSAAIVLLFMWINLGGPRHMARVENLAVAVKVTVLAVFALAGLWVMDPARLAPRHYPGALTVFSSLAVTFFAYEGFRVVTNTAEDLAQPRRNLWRAMWISITLVMGLYVAVALAVYGNLPPERVVAARDYALAEAALPVFGEAGFRLVALAALLSTASGINAALYAVTNVTYQMAKDGGLPAAFMRPIGHSREGLVVSSAMVVVLSVFLSLGQIAAVGSLAVLILHGVVHLGHLRLRRETGARTGLLVAAALATLGTVALALAFEIRRDPRAVWLLAGLFGLGLTLELLLRRTTGRRVRSRLPRPMQWRRPGGA